MRERIGTLAYTVGHLSSWITLGKDQVSKRSESLCRLGLQFYKTKRLSEKVQKELRVLMEEGDCGKVLLFQNMNFQRQLALLEYQYRDFFKDVYAQKEISSCQMNFRKRDLEIQYKELQKIEKRLLFLKNNSF